jgi:hypothetical protein
MPTSVARYQAHPVATQLSATPHAHIIVIRALYQAHPVATQLSVTPYAHIIIISFLNTYRLHAFKYRDWANSRY